MHNSITSAGFILYQQRRNPLSGSTKLHNWCSLKTSLHNQSKYLAEQQNVIVPASFNMSSPSPIVFTFDPSNEEVLRNASFFVVEETFDDFLQCNAEHRKTNLHAGTIGKDKLVLDRIPYIRIVHVIKPAARQVYIVGDLHKVSRKSYTTIVVESCAAWGCSVSYTKHVVPDFEFVSCARTQ
jgi:hypothetical protein